METGDADMRRAREKGEQGRTGRKTKLIHMEEGDGGRKGETEGEKRDKRKNG